MISRQIDHDSHCLTRLTREQVETILRDWTGVRFTLCVAVWPDPEEELQSASTFARSVTVGPKEGSYLTTDGEVHTFDRSLTRAEEERDARAVLDRAEELDAELSPVAERERGAVPSARPQAKRKHSYCAACCSAPCCCAEVAEAERAAIERDAESRSGSHLI